MESRNLLRLLLFLAAVAVIVVGRLALVDQAWLDWLLGLLELRNRQLFDLFPAVLGAGSVASLLVATLGCALLAWTLDVPAATGATAAVTPPRRRGGLVALALFASATALAAAAALLLRRSPPGSSSVALWCAALLVSAAGAWSLDRARGTSFGNPLPARFDRIAVVALVLLDLVVVGHDVGHWAWSGTPDEGNFFPFARDIAAGRSSHFILSETGMYNVHPLLSSYFQAGFMRVFGLDVFGWRLSSAAALAMSLPFVYVLGRELWSRRFGLWSAILFGSAPLAVGFSHFGYNNSQIYPFVTGALACFAWARRRGSALGYWLTGAIAGLAVFTFYPARMALPLVLVLALALGERPWAAALRRLWAVLLLAALIGATPCLVHPYDTLTRMFGQTAFKPAEDEAPATWMEQISAAVAGKGARLARHWSISVLHPLWYPRPSHFQTQAVIDPLQGALALTGFFLAWRGFRRHAGCRFLALAYALSALAVGSVSQHDCPPLTRLLFLCPFTALLAVLALEQILQPLRRIGVSSRMVNVVGTLVVAVAALWGLIILRSSVYIGNHGYGEGTTSEVLRLARTAPPGWRVIYVQRSPTYMQGVDNYASAYGVKERVVYLRESDEILAHMPDSGERGFLLAHDLPNGAKRTELEALLQRRFPGREWRDTAPGKKWNLHVLAVAAEGDGGWRPPLLPDRSPAGRVLLGHLDW